MQKNFIDSFIDWIVKSSANPTQHAMTLRGILLSQVAVVMMLCQSFGVPIMETQVTKWITIVSFVFGLVLIIVGVLRKLWYWFKSTVKM